MATVTIGSDEWLKEVVAARAFQSMSATTRDVNDALLSAIIVWPDGTSGTYTADTLSTSFLGLVDAFHVTYNGATVKTVTQAAYTRDNLGAISTQPALTIS